MGRFVGQFDWRGPRLFGLALAWSWLLPALVRSEDVRSTSIGASRSGEFVSPGRFLFDQILTPVGSRSERLVAGRSVNLPHRPRVSRTNGPLRQVGLVSGDRFSAEVLQWGDDSVELSLVSGQTVTVPKDTLATLSVPPGESEWLAERFESEDALSGFLDEADRLNVTRDRVHAASGDRSLKLSSESKPLVVNCSAGLDAARVQFWFRTERPSSTTTGGRITFVFGESIDSNTLVLELDGPRIAIVSRQDLGARRTTQAVELRTGWHCLTAVLSPQRVLCLVDENLLAAGPGIDAPLRSIRFVARSGLSIDDLAISRLAENAVPRAMPLPFVDDIVATHSGEELFGHVTRLAPRGITLDGIAGEATVPWSRVAAIGFRTPDRPLSGPAAPREGLVARIECQPFVDRPQLPADRLTATIVAIERDGPIVSHPFLGELLLPWRTISRIEPLFVGHELVLDARPVHLGDSIRADFRRPFPDGTEWRSEFALSTKPAGDVWLSLNVADLEPNGPDTPPGSPFLRELRAGRLLTEVFVNDRPVGDLNRLLRFRASPAQTERVRCPLPRDVFRAGHNTIQLRQRPLTENGSDYDDCELSDLRLELRAASTPPLIRR